MGWKSGTENMHVGRVFSEARRQAVLWKGILLITAAVGGEETEDAAGS